jgi:CheY-like chemotaxis protein
VQTKAALPPEPLHGVLRAFASGVVQEVSPPLAMIASNLECMSGVLAELADGQGVGPSSLQDFAGHLVDAREGVERMRRVLRDLRSFTLAPDDKPAQLDVRRVLEAALRIAWNEIGHRARLVKDYGGVSFVESDEARLSEALLVLLLAAARTIPEGQPDTRELRVRTSEEDARALLELRWPSRGANDAGVEEGSWELGFFTAKDLLSNIGGEMTFERSKDAAGTVIVRVRLPLSPSREMGQGSALRASSGARRGHVLVVDDEAAIGRSIKRILGGEHDVTAVTSAREGLERIQHAGPFDLVLCDLMMPERTGMDLYADLRKIRPEMIPRLVFVTGGSYTPQAREFLEIVPNERFSKPIEVDDLRALARRFVK